MSGGPPDFPLITIGIVVLNREWIIGKVLHSILRQTYPHDRILIIVVDGGSVDRTAFIAREVLEKSDFSGFGIIVKKCNIPEGRNICIEKMRGGLLLFWDSDVVMEPDAISKLVNTMKNVNAHIVTADSYTIFLDSVDEVDEKVSEIFKKWKAKDRIYEVPAAGMGHTLICKEVFKAIRFDRDLTTNEDLDFCVRARQKGFKIFMNEGVKVLDINIRRKDYSDIHISMPLRDALRGLKKKAKAKVLASNFTINISQMVKFFIKKKRFAYYLGYMPTLISLSLGIFSGNIPLVLIFPTYLIPYMIHQFKRRGFKKGLNALLKSICVGLPVFIPHSLLFHQVFFF